MATPDSTDLMRLPEEAAAHLQPVSTATIGDAEFERLWRIGLNLAKSGMFKDITQGEQAFAKILLGRDLGLSPAQSLNALYFVRGNLQIAAVTLASFIRRHDSYDYRITEHDDKHCVIEFYMRHPDGKMDLIGESRFDEIDAKAAGLLGKDGPWKQHPRNMYFARAMSNGVKWHCPDLLGGIPVYTEADTFGPQDITDTDAEAEDVTLLPAVEEVVQRAEALGHTALSNRDAAGMATNGQPEATVQAWVARASGTLDAAEDERHEAQNDPPEAEVVEEPDDV